jgi:hypothetical protein
MTSPVTLTVERPRLEAREPVDRFLANHLDDPREDGEPQGVSA